MATRTRDLAWDGCLNVRDLGGHATEDGRETRFGAVVRADSVRRLSDVGWGALVEHGITRIVDLRMQQELDVDPPAALPVEVVHLSVLGELDPEAEAAIDALATTRDVYLEFLERYRSNFARAVAAVGDAPPGGVLIHCHSGKDRTGLLVALLLRLAGVRAAEIADDYALSEQRLAPVLERWIAEAGDETERERRRRISETPREAMLEVLEELERRYGSVRGYLLAGGASEAEIDRAAARLLA
ncbi:MAG: tyrosine-protein phosphatase [Gaiellaceae bacterium]